MYLFLKYTIQRNGIWCAVGRNSSVGCENVCNLGFSIAKAGSVTVSNSEREAGE